MLDRIRKMIVNFAFGPDTLTTGIKGTWRVPAGFKGRVLSASLSLRTTGATSGATTVDVKKSPGGANPASILPAVLSIAQGAATPYVFSKVAGGVGEPNGVPVDGDNADTITVDVTAIPGTASAGGQLFLEVAITDV